MGYNSIACPKCGVSLSIDESMRGKKATCPNCSHQMSIPSYQEDTRSKEATGGTAAPENPVSSRITYGNAPKAAAASVTPSKSFIVSMLMILIVLLVSLIVNVMLLTTFATVKSKLAEKEPVTFQEPVSIRAESRLPVVAIQPQWEYQVVKVDGAPAGTAPDTGSLAFNAEKISDVIQAYAVERWELTGVIPQTETVFPNLNDDPLIPAIQSNTRTRSVILIFKRAK